MQTFQFLALVPLALATPFLETRQACPAPTTFQINGLTAFTPSATQNPTGNSTVSFTFVDSTTGVDTSCSRTGPASGPGDTTHFYPCANANVSFLYGGTRGPFDVKEKINCTGTRIRETAIANSSGAALNCFLIEPPYPGGYGTLCEVPPSAFQIPVTAIVKN